MEERALLGLLGAATAAVAGGVITQARMVEVLEPVVRLAVAAVVAAVLMEASLRPEDLAAGGRFGFGLGDKPLISDISEQVEPTPVCYISSA